MSEQVLNARVSPEGSLEILSRHEVDLLKDKGEGGLYRLFRQCALAVLNCGNESDDAEEIHDAYRDFDIRLVQQPRGLKIELLNAPASAFVDGVMIRGIREHLFSVLRDIVYSHSLLATAKATDQQKPDDLTNLIFHILRNAGVLTHGSHPNMIVCWGGHSISRQEYDYSKEVGHELGLRGLNICTGCGPGAMKGPMKGATIAHAKQRVAGGRYLGITEPGIIAAESPNPIVNKLVIMPDIEKRLEAFVRSGHGIVIFPGGVGTAEEILYILGVLLHPDNRELPFPLIFTGSAENADYFEMMDNFIRAALGEEAASRYRIIIDDPAEVARQMSQGMEQVRDYRRQKQDAYYFNWLLKIDPIFQQPFEPTHESMLGLDLSSRQPPHLLAANLRCAFSGIVAGNVKEQGVAQVKLKGPFEISGDPKLLGPLEVLLDAFVKQGRMKLPGHVYRPSYRIVPAKHPAT
ncbi:nucleotide 5'-monophosphate nucleosidase PpnN [Hydrocarboniclastica marina]|uniref:AMP nucleosidase n=1 Tax=Hydrocarboniclastica marina TaxID=2259620 RepID=A0A4V1D938_9ALTE|nr:nucleotide 5'-monophosphate nucleosidase PpnN [Hydrocarboniclastica marina]MAL97451.1 LOG family protein [Alteromonadaceae bacterium]QCF27340.1 LOG family protein [Hydrocarboniclastica marina]